MVDEEDKVEDLVVDDPEAETAEAPVIKATEAETAETPVVEPVKAEADEAPVVEAIEAETAEATENESVAAEPVLAAVAEASEPAPVETPAAEAAVATDKKEPASNRRWYVVHAYSGFESYVKKVLESRIATSEHKKKFGEILVPTEEVVEMREGNRRKSERKFFPGYVLVQMEMDSDTWHLVKQVPKVLGFIGGTSDKPAPISEAEADAILNRVEEGVDKPRPKVLFEVGEVVRVNDGPFNDFNGVVEEVNYEKSKMLVSVQIFGRSTPVELAFGQVEKG
jgi:transcriptional antiterminator NusG